MKFVNVNYEQAHNIVSSNKNLMWDGWNMIEYRYDADAPYTVDARFINGKWAKIRIYKPDSSGWRVPQKYVIQ
jgi:hypothetical protein